MDGQEKPKKTFFSGIGWIGGMGLAGLFIGLLFSSVFNFTGAIGIGLAIGAIVGFVIKKIVK